MVAPLENPVDSPAVPILCQNETDTTDIKRNNGTNRKDLSPRELIILGKRRTIASTYH